MVFAFRFGFSGGTASGRLKQNFVEKLALARNDSPVLRTDISANSNRSLQIDDVLLAVLFGEPVFKRAKDSRTLSEALESAAHFGSNNVPCADFGSGISR